MKNTYFSGINGIGMSGLALILKKLGYNVAGSDLVEKDITNVLRDNGIEVILSQERKNLENRNIDIYVYSTAISSNNEEYDYALKNGIKMYRRGELLAEIMNKLEIGIAVAGTHGKTTTSSLASISFLSKDPYIAVGGIIPEIGSNSRVGNSQYFIAEADESDNSFLHMHPYYSIITNIEEDHLDFHKNFDNIRKSFNKFVEQTKHIVLACYDDEEVRKLRSNKIKYYSVYEENKNNVSIYAKNIHSENGKTKFEVIKEGKNLGQFSLSIPGLHNVSNALAVIYIATEEGVDIESLKISISKFKGAKRRYQVIYDNKFRIIDDYAHHPTEIEATIKAAKMNEGKEINVIFQPHRYSRTKFFFDDFIKALSLADNVYILPIYAASEENIYNIHSEDISIKIGPKAKCFTKEDLFDYLYSEDKNNKVYIFMGAGSVSKFAHDFVGGLSK